MKNAKTNKGITLVALIITIVILMVLAGVAISSIQNNGILAYAQNSATAWDSAQRNEVGIIGGYEQYLNKIENGEDTGNGENTGNGEETCLHEYEYGDPYCIKCYQECNHSNRTTVSYHFLPDELKHYSTGGGCIDCGMGLDEEYPWIWAVDCEFENGVCKVCGGENGEYMS